MDTKLQLHVIAFIAVVGWLSVIQAADVALQEVAGDFTIEVLV